MKEIWKVIQKLSHEQKYAAYEQVQKHKITRVYRGDLIIRPKGLHL